MCQICHMRHPTVIHIQSTKTPQQDDQLKAIETGETSISSALVSANDATGAGRDCALAIVPVRVKVAKGKVHSDLCILGSEQYSNILHRESYGPSECERMQNGDSFVNIGAGKTHRDL